MERGKYSSRVKNKQQNLVYMSGGTHEKVEGALCAPLGRDSTSPPPNSSLDYVSAMSPPCICSWPLDALLSMSDIIANRVVSRVAAVGLEPLVV